MAIESDTIMKVIIALLAAVCLTSNAQVLIYKNALTRTTTGAGSTSKTVISGWTVINMTNGVVNRIEAVKATKTFKVYNVICTTTLPRGSAGKTYTVFAMTQSGLNSAGYDVRNSETAKGVNVTLDIGLPIDNGNAPRSLQFVGRASYTSGGEAYLEETAGTLAIVLKDTSQANFENMSFEEVVQAGRDSLVQNGYIDATP